MQACFAWPQPFQQVGVRMVEVMDQAAILRDTVLAVAIQAVATEAVAVMEAVAECLLVMPQAAV